MSSPFVSLSLQRLSDDGKGVRFLAERTAQQQSQRRWIDHSQGDRNTPLAPQEHRSYPQELSFQRRFPQQY